MAEKQGQYSVMTVEEAREMAGNGLEFNKSAAPIALHLKAKTLRQTEEALVDAMLAQAQILYDYYNDCLKTESSSPDKEFRVWLKEEAAFLTPKKAESLIHLFEACRDISTDILHKFSCESLKAWAQLDDSLRESVLSLANEEDVDYLTKPALNKLIAIARTKEEMPSTIQEAVLSLSGSARSKAIKACQNLLKRRQKAEGVLPESLLTLIEDNSYQKDEDLIDYLNRSAQNYAAATSLVQAAPAEAEALVQDSLEKDLLPETADLISNSSQRNDLVLQLSRLSNELTQQVEALSDVCLEASPIKTVTEELAALGTKGHFRVPLGSNKVVAVQLELLSTEE